MDRTLDEKLAAMNASLGHGRTDAMAVVIDEMANQRALIRQKTMAMHRIMMQHMMEHMRAGRPLPECPMMRAMQPGAE